ncbi:MAG: bis-aminopropyl spermidine synthase family protein [Myxococcota bacterium]
MRRLVDGCYAWMAPGALDSEVRSIHHPRTFSVPAQKAEQLRVLAHGIPDDAPASPLFLELQQAGFAAEDLDPVDPDVVQQLSLLGNGFSWHLDGCPRADKLVDLVRRAHAQRKVVDLTFGQASCIPESAVLRCWQLTRARKGPQRVLLIGDDDLLCLPLARMGHKVTVLDIDGMLVEFIERLARAEKLKADARVQDVRDPLPDELAGRFDAVMMDPMSYEPCLMAFMCRATNALKRNGTLYCCVHPLARQLFEDVVGRHPLRLERCLYELSVYYYEGFLENWYRSDLYALRRTDGESPWAASEPLPLGDIISGAFRTRHHGFTDITPPPLRRPDLATVRAAVEAYLTRAKVNVVARQEHDGENWAHLYVATDGGGHLAVVLDKRKGVVSYALYPFTMARDIFLSESFARFLAIARVRTFSREANDLATPAVSTPARVARSTPRRRVRAR